ncbi:MAG: helix-turn-helix domain-containing protein [Gammaproteobacteria bacterium]
MNDMGGRIRKQREALNLSRAQLAAKVGVSEQLVGQWERGIVVNIRPENMMKLTELFGVSQKYLVRGTSMDKSHRAHLVVIGRGKLSAGDLVASVWDKLKPATREVIYALVKAELGSEMERRTNPSKPPPEGENRRA